MVFYFLADNFAFIPSCARAVVFVSQHIQFQFKIPATYVHVTFAFQNDVMNCAAITKE